MDDRFESHDLTEKNNANENEASHDLHSENPESPLIKRKKQPGWKTMLSAVCFALIGSICGSLITLAAQREATSLLTSAWAPIKHAQHSS